MNKRDILKLAGIVMVLIGAVFLIRYMTSRQDREETAIVREAIKNAALTCYAVEGAYPEDVSYLREYYQLAYDENRYFITYESFAPNIIPSIYVTERGAKMP